MIGLTYLDLPPLPTSIEQSLLAQGKQINTFDHHVDYCTDLYGYPQCASGYTDNVGFSDHTTAGEAEVVSSMDHNTYQKIKSLIEPILKMTVYPTIIKFSNQSTHESVDNGPHCDITRSIGLNYQIQIGGKNVFTSIYKETRSNDNTIPQQAELCTDDKLTLIKHHRVPKRTWHVLDVQRFHAIRNIENERIFLSLLKLSSA